MATIHVCFAVIVIMVIGTVQEIAVWAQRVSCEITFHVVSWFILSEML